MIVNIPEDLPNLRAIEVVVKDVVAGAARTEGAGEIGRELGSRGAGPTQVAKTTACHKRIVNELEKELQNIVWDPGGEATIGIASLSNLSPLSPFAKGDLVVTLKVGLELRGV